MIEGIPNEPHPYPLTQRELQASLKEYPYRVVQRRSSQYTDLTEVTWYGETDSPELLAYYSRKTGELSGIQTIIPIT